MFEWVTSIERSKPRELEGHGGEAGGEGALTVGSIKEVTNSTIENWKWRRWKI